MVHTPNEPQDLACWETAPLPELVKHLVTTFHGPTRVALDHLNAELDALLATPGEPHELLARLQPHVRHLTEDLKGHLAEEERSLFPALLKLEKDPQAEVPAETLDPLHLLMAEHDSATELVDNLRILTTDYTPPDGASPALQSWMAQLAALEDSLHRHLFLENHLLFPRALAKR